MLIGSNLIINDYTPSTTAGALGLNMTGPEAAPQNPSTTTTITGDLSPVDFSPTVPAEQTDALGNIITNPNAPQPNRVDVLYDSNANDLIVAGGGDEIVEASRHSLRAEWHWPGGPDERRQPDLHHPPGPQHH